MFDKYVYEYIHYRHIYSFSTHRDNMIDVHMMRMASDNKIWYEECLSSLSQEKNINLIETTGIPGNTLQARINAYSLGSSKYVSFVDPDDRIEPGIFERCYQVLEDNPSLVGCYTMSLVIDENNRKLNTFCEYSFNNLVGNLTEIHQLVVIRRELNNKVNHILSAEKLLPHHISPEHIRYVLLGTFGQWKALPIIGYHWRKYGNMGRIHDKKMLDASYLHLLNKLISKLQ